MRVLFDQGTPEPLRHPLTEHSVETAYERGWSTLENGQLLRAAEGVSTLDRLNAAVSLRSLSLPGLRLEKLKGDRAGQHSIRINDRFRICFRWTDTGAEDVEIVDYH